jgi:hypothetical protein
VIDESETSGYEVPKEVIKPYPGDTGYKLVKKNYRRMIWTWKKFTQMNESVDVAGAARAYAALEKLLDMFDGYVSEHGDDDGMWEAGLQQKIDVLFGPEGTVKTVEDIVDSWDDVRSVAAGLVEGAENYLAKHGEAQRYLPQASSAVRSVKKLFSI